MSTMRVGYLQSRNSSIQLLFMVSIKKLVFILIFISSFGLARSQDRWIAPESSDQIKNPEPSDEASLKSGEKIFKSVCWTCHGQQGLGDGPAAAGLNPKPGNFTADSFKEQSDGAIFWKISEGRGVMTPFKSSLTTKQRWQLVNYLRTFK